MNFIDILVWIFKVFGFNGLKNIIFIDFSILMDNNGVVIFDKGFL